MGVYLYCITDNYFYESSIRGRSFDNAWCSIQEDGIIIIKGSHYKGYAWDGCSPKIKIKDIYFGTCEGVLSYDTKQSKTYYASLVHDVLYQFSPAIRKFIKRKEADVEFYTLLKKDGFCLAYLYYSMVRLFGWIYWQRAR